MLDRNWDFQPKPKSWLFRSNGAKLGHKTVAVTVPTRFKNVVLLLERGFRPSSGGKWCRESANGSSRVFVDSTGIDLPHEKFLKHLRNLQRRDWVLVHGDEERPGGEGSD